MQGGFDSTRNDCLIAREKDETSIDAVSRYYSQKHDSGICSVGWMRNTVQSVGKLKGEWIENTAE